jgi:hypothetical protein
MAPAAAASMFAARDRNDTANWAFSTPRSIAPAMRFRTAGRGSLSIDRRGLAARTG